jgi:hypothetical protein
MQHFSHMEQRYNAEMKQIYTTEVLQREQRRAKTFTKTILAEKRIF